MVFRHLPKLITLAGFLVLAHTTVAVIKHREVLKLTQEEYDTLPPALLTELAVGLLLASAGAFIMSGTLRPALTSSLGGITDIGSFKFDFVQYNTRAKALRLPVGAQR